MGRSLAALVVTVLAVVSCARDTAPAPNAPAASSPSPVGARDGGTEPSAAALPPVAATAAPSTPDAGALECLARSGDKTIELFLTWDRNIASGSLRTSGGGPPTTRLVTAELYKGLVLVNPDDAPGPENRIATLQEEGARTIQVGDWHQPFLPCEGAAR